MNCAIIPGKPGSISSQCDVIWEWFVHWGGILRKDKIFVWCGVVSICEKQRKEREKKPVQRTKKEKRLVDVDFVKEPLPV